jgi:regulator of sirC expression with transglutaminase-like and TPR domain
MPHHTDKPSESHTDKPLAKRSRTKRRPTAPFAPTCCAPDAFDLMARQVAASKNGPRLASDEGLLDAACAVALHLTPTLDVRDASRKLNQLAKNAATPFGGLIKTRARAAVAPQAIVAHLHRAMFDEAGFAGNTSEYYRPENSSLPDVLESRRGLPISLALVYKLVAGRLGLDAWGVGLPGHFVAGLEMDGQVLVDCFDGGRLLDQRDAAARVAACAGPEVPFDTDLLRPVSHRHWITRLMQNLLQVFQTENRPEDVAAILELEILLWPEEDHLRRDLGLVLARLNQPRAAKGWLDSYLKRRPDDPQGTDLQELVAALA